MFYRLSKILAQVLCKILFRYEVKGRANIPSKGGFILASNHVSYLDPIIVGIASTREVSFMAKEELFVNCFVSWYIKKLGGFPVKRSSADLSAMKEAIQRLQSGRGVVIFPEGSRRFDGGQTDPHAGIGLVASKAGVPIVPAFVSGTDKALPKGAKFIRPKKITVNIGEQISVERSVPYAEVAHQVMDNIRRLSCSN